MEKFELAVALIIIEAAALMYLYADLLETTLKPLA